ncbi:MAG: hypothetical protein NVV68_08340 [Dokdonella sp.]|jgi:hypothetical protein|nr:hypothetical protein [Dokdonella sp.]
MSIDRVLPAARPHRRRDTGGGRCGEQGGGSLGSAPVRVGTDRHRRGNEAVTASIRHAAAMTDR